MWLLGLALLWSGVAQAACVPAQILRDDVLIVVNANAEQGTAVGDYYCTQRGIDPGNIAQVYLPAVDTVALDQFVALRDQLIRFLQQHTLSGSEPPVVCDTALGYTKYYCPESVDQIRRLTRIRYLVLTRGVPIKFEFTGSSLPYLPRTSIDNYLRFWLLNYYPQDTEFSSNQRAEDFTDGRGMRTIVPARDREFIVGRIDGITADNAKQLVDRALAAERNGIYGKLVSSRFGKLASATNASGAYWKQWLPGGQYRTVYPSWQYLHGLFGDLLTPDTLAVTHRLNPQCLTHDGDGISPQDCVTRLTENAPLTGNSPGPGTPWGAIPRADRALVYQGYADGFSSQYSFDTMLNWRVNDSCATLCDPADQLCRALSTDAFREIDTRCVRVADGFMGYNLQSFPLGLMYGSPTGWSVDVATGADRWNHISSGSISFREPRVREDTGFDDNNSIWFEDARQLPGARCYAGGDDLGQPPQGACATGNKILISQIVPVPEQALNPAAPQVVTVRFRYRALNLNRDLPLQAWLLVHESEYSDANVTITADNQIDYLRTPAASLFAPQTPADGVSWGEAVATYTLDPALHRHPQRLFDAFKVRILSTVEFEGQLAIDTVSVAIDGVNVPLQNPSFSEGHRQLSGGDSAANFLGRLNGVAFWGNLTHHGISNGRSFDTHPYETLIYFLRGLPLGDAVWFAETRNAGILYGDPLYSPIAVHLHYLPNALPGAERDTFDRRVPLVLRGDTVNGRGSDVTTTYSIDYCAGRDFFVCDQLANWVPVAGLQHRPGGGRDMVLGTWDAAQLAPGGYTLRLAVASSNAATGMTQTFYDYYPLSLQDTPVTLNGTITNAAGSPLCAIVLASGRHVYSCNASGAFALPGLPREADGRVKLQVYADGFRPYVVYVETSGVHNIVLTAAGTCPDHNPSYTPAVNTAWPGQYRNITGRILDAQTQQPVCALVLANGQHMFSCDGGGNYALNIPLDANGQFKLQVYADGFAPYTIRLDEQRTVNTVLLAHASACQ
ncbi:MAG: hypothetical protein R3F42_06760 [Pseudomonadota bacterium]